MTPREQIIAEAREWVGTPWRHQAALKGTGCDCIGFVTGVARVFLGPIEVPRAYSERWHLYRAESLMRTLFAERAEEIAPEEAQPGDVLLFGAGKGPAHHCGFLTAPHSWGRVDSDEESCAGSRVSRHAARARPGMTPQYEQRARCAGRDDACGFGLIHCYREAGRVVEQTLTEWWRKNLRHAFRFPGAV